MGAGSAGGAALADAPRAFAWRRLPPTATSDRSARASPAATASGGVALLAFACALGGGGR